MIGIIGIIVGLALLVYLAYKGYSIVWVAPLSALVVALFGFGLNGKALLDSYLNSYMASLAGFAKGYFPLFFLGAVFGKMMETTGAAQAVAALLARLFGAKRALLAVVLSAGILVYGGVSLFVAAFAVYPLAIPLYREANLPRRLIPGAYCLGAFTFVMTAIPGSPSLNNIISAKYFGTTLYAAPILGIVSGAILFFGGYYYLLWKQNKLVKAGEHFTEPEVAVEAIDEKELPGAFVSVLPLVVVIVALYVFTRVLTFDVTSGTVLALLLACIVTVCCNLGKLKEQLSGADKKVKNFVLRSLNEGGAGAITATLNTAAAVGFGGVVRTIPGFKVLTDYLLGMQASPLISEGITISILAGATGSSSGGLGIALEALAPQYLTLAAKTGLSPETLHRIATVASGGLDSLPHCGGVLTVLAICGMTHKDSYNDIGVVTCVIPIIGLIVITILGSMGVV
ncbi:MAG: GntP family permease [Fusobacteriaceae bacterium]|jgi:H+/gluconate symporter-like permease|nr:GntP family permease [Fusobacteriaceae bacterium]